MTEKKGEVHIHHHYAPPVKPRPRARVKRKRTKKSNKKVFSVIINIIEELVRLA